MGIEVTPRAAVEIGRIKTEQGNEGAFLRLSVKGGGCSGFSYDLDFTKESTEFDHEFESHGVKILVDKKSYLFLNGTVIDFDDGLLNRGFKFNNPLAKASCGCGSSFGV